jgi:hypothetical protein
MRKFLLVVVALFIVNSVFSQAKFGVKGGVNLASSNDSGDKIKIGPNIGVLGQYKLSGSGVAFQSEILYSAKGAKGGGNATINFDYINIPVLAQYYVAPCFNLEFGPYIGFLTSAKIKWGSGSDDIKDECNTVDYGLNFGAACELTTLPLGLFARYSLGLNDVWKNWGSVGNKHRVIQIGAFLKF